MEINYKIDNPQASHLRPWLVLINGLFASLESWNESVGYLTPHFRVLRYDCRGQGGSTRPTGPYLLSEHVDDLRELLETLKIENPVLMGISNGGRIALAYANQYPDKVKAIVAADTYDNVSPLMANKLLSWKRANKLGGPMHRFDVATPWVWGESIVDERPDLLELYRQNAWKEKSWVIEGLIDGALMEKVELTDFDVPTLLVVGEEDLLTPPFMQKRMMRKFKQAKLETVKGGHASLLEYPQSVKESVLPYLMEHI